MAKFRIQDIRKFPAADPARRGSFDTIVVYQMIDTGQVYFLTVPKGEPSESDIQAGVKKDIAGRSAMIGKEFEV